MQCLLVKWEQRILKMAKIYISIAAAALVSFFIYGRVQYSKGYDKSVADNNQRIIELLRDQNEAKNKIQKKVKELQDVLKNNKDWSSNSIPDDVVLMLNE